ncbi:hypothetical protein JCM19294_2963 [Nonlabens tegetincola]|uniref:Uncharacterized protein n=1 Tax=Nonlabens tegetincola TaxID=323273 RepID=A0A090QKY0_9FLAO|nr:hypothetical protein JCM19294_2963 [Nonlabens tegetincola]
MLNKQLHIMNAFLKKPAYDRIKYCVTHLSGLEYFCDGKDITSTV